MIGTRLRMTVLLTLVVLALTMACAAATAQDVPENEAAQWQFTGMLGIGEIPVTWNISYRVYDSSKWAGWVDGFMEPSDQALGAGLSAQYKPLKIPWFDAAGAGALYIDGDWKPTIYLKKTIATF